MAKQANRMMIGGFVVLAVFLLAASIVVFGSGRFFKKTELYVMYFEGSVKGLSVGAPLLLRGVPIGTVKSLVLRVDPDTGKTEIPVVVEVAKGQLEVVGEKKFSLDTRRNLNLLVDEGLRGVLSLQSIITGQLLIELDFYPNSPVNLRETDLPYPQVPTLPSTIYRLGQALQGLDLEGMVKKIQDTLKGIDALVNNQDLSASLVEFKGILVDAHSLVRNLDDQVRSLSGELETTISDARRLINNVDDQVAPVAASGKRTLAEFGQLARNLDRQLASLGGNLNKTLTAARGVVSEQAPLIVEMERSLQEISNMARAFRELAEYLERHPESLIQGKGSSGGD